MRGPYTEADWRREALRTNLWLVPVLETALIAVLFGMTYTVDRLAYDGLITLPTWVLSGTADVARVLLATVAAAIITVVGIVFSITIVALTLASTQFGSFDRLVERTFDTIRQAAIGMPAIMIRQLDAIAKVIEQVPDRRRRTALIRQAEAIQRSNLATVPDASDRDDVTQRYEAVMALIVPVVSVE